MEKKLEIFKSNLNFVRTVYVPFMKLRNSAYIEVIVFLGFYFIILNIAHMTIAYKNLENLIRTSDLGCIVPIVRVKNFEETYIGKAIEGCLNAIYSLIQLV